MLMTNPVCSVEYDNTGTSAASGSGGMQRVSKVIWVYPTCNVNSPSEEHKVF